MFSRGFCILPTPTNHNLTHRTFWKDDLQFWSPQQKQWVV